MKYTIEYNINNKIIEVTRVNNDVYGNPRYVVHYLDIADTYYKALESSRKIGGKVYRGKDYGGGIVFTSYDIEGDLTSIIKVK